MFIREKKNIPLGLICFVCMSFAYLTAGTIFILASPAGDVAGHPAGRVIIGVILLAYGICRGLWGWNLIYSEKNIRSAEIRQSDIPHSCPEHGYCRDNEDAGTYS